MHRLRRDCDLTQLTQSFEQALWMGAVEFSAGEGLLSLVLVVRPEALGLVSWGLK